MTSDFKNEWKGVVSVIGASEIDKETEEKTIEIGRLLARNKFIVSCGGLSGVMEAICKGAKKEGGITIGIIPFKDKNAANQYVDIAIPVPFSQARNIVVVLTGDVIVAIAGKAGTLSEISFSWIYGKPIVALTNVEGWSAKIAGQKLDDRRSDIIYGAKTPIEVVDKVKELMNISSPKGFSFSPNES
jgi:uncharacterized protein (TIGR00725 family)